MFEFEKQNTILHKENVCVRKILSDKSITNMFRVSEFEKKNIFSLSSKKN